MPHQQTVKKVRVLAVASGGGHWIQLLRLRPAFSQCDVTYVSTSRDGGVGLDAPYLYVPDANLDKPVRLSIVALHIFWLLLKQRPEVILTTGAAPGFLAIVIGRLLGSRTIWIDSIANSEQLSTSGKYARKVAHVCLTQWEHLADEAGALYWGAVL